MRIIIIGIISELFFGRFNKYLCLDIDICFIITRRFRFIGYIENKLKNSSGLKSRYKFLGQIIISFVTLFILINYSDHEYLYNLYFPFFKNLIWYMGYSFIPFGLFVIIGASNAVNLTDGLDGLATVPVMLVALSFTLISYVVEIQFFQNIYRYSIFLM